MNAGKIRTVLLFPLLACCLAGLAASSVHADLSAKQARKAITRMVGFELKNSAVRVKTISTTNGSAEVSAEIKTVFKFSQDKQGQWRVAEIRTGQDHWEEIELIAEVLKTQLATNGCTALEPPPRGPSATDPSVKRVRCLLGSLLGVEIPSDAIRIQEVNPFSVPLASQLSATVVTWLKVEIRLVNDNVGWRVSELRTGNRGWMRLDPIIAALNEEKQKTARAELELMAKALERFRKDWGFYVVSDSQAVAIDHLNPRYLAQLIRMDPWHQPYRYQGERDHFILRSTGPDGKADTADDIQLQSPSR